MGGDSAGLGAGGRRGNRVLGRLGAASAPLLVAHRGASALAPENTLLAAERAWRDGAVAWEFDVHLSRDGVPVVIHDESLLRTTDVAERFPDDPRRRR
ncbi:MAG: glycerophosphodiester phosphodiesterase, partial [Verrucomicrobiae bacterium]|nr:glycerophosphodiester phosphodiesterase [Verrucomicrobiae bacterium]